MDARRARAARLPGPRWPSAFTAAQFAADPFGFFPRLRQRYGDVFRLSFPGYPAGIAVTDLSLSEAVLADAGRFPAGPANRLVFGFLDGDEALVCVEGERHRALRRALGPVASWPRRHADVIAEAFEEQVGIWPLDRVIAIRPRVEPIVLDLVMRSSLGVSAREAPGLAAAIRSVSRRARPLLPVPALRHNFGPLSPWWRFQRARRQLEELLQPLLERPPSGDHALASLTQGPATDGLTLSIEQLRDQALNLLMAGVEATAVSVAWAFERLAAHPAAMREARGAARAGQNDYLDAVVRESLRLRPPFPHVWRIVGRDVELDGFALPQESLVIIGIGGLHLRPDLFPQPNSFRPERHMDGPGRGWIPFGGGSRACLGATMARHVMSAALATALRRGALEPAGRRERPVQWGGTVVPARGGRVRLVPRAP